MLPQPPPGAPGPAWCLNPLLELHWKHWGGVCLVFEAVSGETAVLDPLDAALLGCFDDKPLQLSELEAALAAGLGGPPGTPSAQVPRNEVLAALEALASRGWIDTAPGPA